MSRVLVTGGMGYIGAHTVVALTMAGYDVVVLDNQSNSTLDVDALRSLCPPGRGVHLVVGDVRDEVLVLATLREYAPAAVLHFAGLKAVGESIQAPCAYYDTNVGGTLTLVRSMMQTPVRTLVFSSSATVYDLQSHVELTEDSPLAMPEHPYGRSKLMAELMLRDVYRADPRWRIALLRYFNPVGGHASGKLPERPVGTPNNLMPFIVQAAAGEREFLSIFGNDYPTPDGTCVRDFVHVCDVADGHVATLRYLDSVHAAPLALNLGTGGGTSVNELVQTFVNVNQVPVPVRYAPRRPGDAPQYWANTSKAKLLLGWQAHRTLHAMCQDAWRPYALQMETP